MLFRLIFLSFLVFFLSFCSEYPSLIKSIQENLSDSEWQDEGTPSANSESGEEVASVDSAIDVEEGQYGAGGEIFEAGSDVDPSSIGEGDGSNIGEDGEVIVNPMEAGISGDEYVSFEDALNEDFESAIPDRVDRDSSDSTVRRVRRETRNSIIQRSDEVSDSERRKPEVQSLLEAYREFYDSLLKFKDFAEKMVEARSVHQFAFDLENLFSVYFVENLSGIWPLIRESREREPRLYYMLSRSYKLQREKSIKIKEMIDRLDERTSERLLDLIIDNTDEVILSVRKTITLLSN